MTRRQTQILAALRHGPLDMMTIADELEVAPFTIRAELHALRRERYVTDRHHPGLWELTDRGAALTWNADQLRLEESR